MANMYFRPDDEWIICTAPYMEAYIPKILFSTLDDADEKESTLAFAFGEGFKVLGVFNIRIMNNEDDDPEKAAVRTFIYPNIIETYPTEFEVRKLSLNGKEVEEYYVFKYYPGDRIMPVKTQQSSQNCTKFLGVLLAGKIPETIPYDQLTSIWIKNFEINGVDPGIPPATMEAVISELCRAKSDLNKPFRKLIGKTDAKVSPYDYYSANVRQVTALTNAMSALTFEDAGFMTAAAINMTRKGTKQNASSFENILRV